MGYSLRSSVSRYPAVSILSLQKLNLKFGQAPLTGCDAAAFAHRDSAIGHWQCHSQAAHRRPAAGQTESESEGPPACTVTATLKARGQGGLNFNLGLEHRPDATTISQCQIRGVEVRPLLRWRA